MAKYESEISKVRNGGQMRLERARVIFRASVMSLGGGEGNEGFGAVVIPPFGAEHAEWRYGLCEQT